MSGDPRTVSALSVAGLRRVAVRTVTEWCREGRIPGADHSGAYGTWHIPVASLEAVPVRSPRGKRICRKPTPMRLLAYGGVMNSGTPPTASLREQVASAHAELDTLKQDLRTLEEHRDAATGKEREDAERLVQAQRKTIHTATRKVIALKRDLTVRQHHDFAVALNLATIRSATRVSYKL